MKEEIGERGPNLYINGNTQSTKTLKSYLKIFSCWSIRWPEASL